MKKEKSTNYTTYSLNKVDAPNKTKSPEPKGAKITTSADLRVGGKK